MTTSSESFDLLVLTLEALLMAAEQPMNEEQLLRCFEEGEGLDIKTLRQALAALQTVYTDRSIELSHIASGYRFQVKPDYAAKVSRLWEEKPAKYSRALLETLSLIAYRQPITRGEIEDIRGVAVSTSIIKTLEEREWVRVVGHRDVPGRPALFATTRTFLDYFGLRSLEQLPSLPALVETQVVSLKEALTQQEEQIIHEQENHTSEDQQNSQNGQENSQEGVRVDTSTSEAQENGRGSSVSSEEQESRETDRVEGVCLSEEQTDREAVSQTLEDGRDKESKHKNNKKDRQEGALRESEAALKEEVVCY